jgi:hypothetical protein
MQETVADFKHRLALMIRERETGKKYSFIGAARSHQCVVRSSSSNNKPKRDKHDNAKNQN